MSERHNGDSNQDQVSWGRWRVTDTTTERDLPKKAVVEVLLDPGEFTIKCSDGHDVHVPYEKTFVQVNGPRKATIYVGDERVWLEAQGFATTVGLEHVLESRRARPVTAALVREAILVVNYPGRTQADAAALFATHAQELAADGYRPVAQSWGEGRPGAGRVMMLGEFATAIRPKGFLTVTYELRAAERVQPSLPVPDLIDQIRRLGELRDAGLVTPEEFDAKKAELLARM